MDKELKITVRVKDAEKVCLPISQRSLLLTGSELPSGNIDLILSE